MLYSLEHNRCLGRSSSNPNGIIKGLSKIMKIAIISPDYPSKSYSSFSFVHARAKLYKKKQNKVEVFILDDHDLTYDFERVGLRSLFDKNAKNTWSN